MIFTTLEYNQESRRHFVGLRPGIGHKSKRFSKDAIITYEMQCRALLYTKKKQQTVRLVSI